MKILAALACLALLSPAHAADVDWAKARALHQRVQAGGELSAKDQASYDEAKRQRATGGGQGQQRPVPAPKGLVPLTELTAAYKGQDGGLYGGGKNEPPAARAALAQKAIGEIKPLDRDGKPAADGKIVLLSIGMSNTTQEFSAFVQKANADPRKAAPVVIVDGAQGGKDATAWATAAAPPWAVAAQRLQAAGVSPAQVQAVWIKQALISPQTGFPAESDRLRTRLREIVALARDKYPNLRVAYLSSRIYAGYATTTLNPEPYAYESAFAVRGIIQEQARGELPAAPVLLWGPYLWANGETARKADALTYARADLTERDDTHPSASGREKVAKLLLDFFTTSPLAKPWFIK